MKAANMGPLSYLIFFLTVLQGCASYVTPGGSINLTDISSTTTASLSPSSTTIDPSISGFMAIEPAANFPASMIIARVQAPKYRSRTAESFGEGRYSVVTTRDVEEEEDFDRMANMPLVNAAGPLNRILLPTRLDSIKSLRTASARLKADILLIYTFDTALHVGNQQFRPLNLVSLGFLNNKEVTVTTTASAAFYDVRTEFLYGLSEATARKSEYASVWSSSDVVDDLRRTTEQQAFHSLVPEIEKTWLGIINTHVAN